MCRIRCSTWEPPIFRKGGVWPAHYHESLSAILCDKCQGKQKAQYTDNNGCHWHRAWHQSLFCVFCGCHRFLLCIRCILICSVLTRFHFFLSHKNIKNIYQWLSCTYVLILAAGPLKKFVHYKNKKKAQSN